MADKTEPDWLVRMRQASVQRPRTQFQKVRWADIQALLREHALLLEGADVKMLRAIDTLRREQNPMIRGPQSG